MVNPIVENGQLIGSFNWVLDPLFLIQLFSMAILVFILLWREVIDPYRKRDWLRAYMITTSNHIKPLDIKPKSDYFEWNGGTYFFPKDPFTRQYKITVKKAALYKEGKIHPLVYEQIDTTKGKLKTNPDPEEFREAVKAQNMKQLMTPKLPWKEQLLFVLLGIGTGVAIGLMMAPQVMPCPVCP